MLAGYPRPHLKHILIVRLVRELLSAGNPRLTARSRILGNDVVSHRTVKGSLRFARELLGIVLALFFCKNRLFDERIHFRSTVFVRNSFRFRRANTFY